LSVIQPFRGFPKQGLQFLKELAANNNRAWFLAHKAEYESYLLNPAVAFVTALGAKLQSISPGIHVDPRSSGSGNLMRFHRDTRFSADKSPYKTAIAGMFWEGPGKKTQSPAFGFHMEAASMDLMAGIFMFSKPLLAAYRQAVVDEGRGLALEAALRSVAQAGDYKISGEHYKRVPRDFDAEHPRADLLRYNALYASSPQIGPDALTTPDLVDLCFEHLRSIAPLQQWLVQVSQAVE